MRMASIEDGSLFQPRIARITRILNRHPPPIPLTIRPIRVIRGQQTGASTRTVPFFNHEWHESHEYLNRHPSPIPLTIRSIRVIRGQRTRARRTWKRVMRKCETESPRNDNQATAWKGNKKTRERAGSLIAHSLPELSGLRRSPPATNEGRNREHSSEPTPNQQGMRLRNEVRLGQTRPVLEVHVADTGQWIETERQTAEREGHRIPDQRLRARHLLIAGRQVVVE